MIRRGKVTWYSNGKAKVFFLEISAVTPEIDVCSHVGMLEINDIVLVAFHGASLADGAVIGKVG